MNSQLTNRQILLRFVTLPFILGGLAGTIGITGLYITHKSKTELRSLDEQALTPALSFQKNFVELEDLGKIITRLEYVKDAKTKQSIVDEGTKQIHIIDQSINDRLNEGRGHVYEDFLTSWVNDWKHYSSKWTEKQNELEKKSIDPETFDFFSDGLSVMRNRLTNIGQFIRLDVKVRKDEFFDFIRSSLIVLIASLIMGTLIGSGSSILIVSNLNKLFQVIANGKRNIETILNSLSQGFFVFDRKGQIQESVSLAATKYYESSLAGKGFEDVIPLSDSAKQTLNEWYELAFSQALPFEDICGIAPQNFKKHDRYFELNYVPIFADDTKKNIEQVICITSDKTEELKLREKAIKEAETVALMMTILKDKQAFLEFVFDAKQILERLREESEKLNPQVTQVFRDMHSLKGGCAAFHIHDVATFAHQKESWLSQFRSLPTLPEAERPLLIDAVKTCDQLFKQFIEHHASVLGDLDGNNRTKTIPIQSLQKILYVLFSDLGHQSTVFKAYVNEFLLDDFSAGFKKFESVVSNLADKQGKCVEMTCERGSAFVLLDRYSSLLSTFIHLFRNAVDHGIESPEDRVEAGKEEMAHVKVSFKVLPDSMVDIQIQDDGKGIDPNIIRKKAVEKGVITEDEAKTLSDYDAIQIILKPNFSTKDTVSEVSGRGVGLDAVFTEAVRIGGHVFVESTKGQGSTFHIKVPLFNQPDVPTDFAHGSSNEEKRAA